MMKLGSFATGLIACLGALLSSLSCFLPRAVILVELRSGAFMAVTMRRGRWFTRFRTT
jgi:hypothetical protein